jgi:hypothetical protein
VLIGVRDLGVHEERDGLAGAGAILARERHDGARVLGGQGVRGGDLAVVGVEAGRERHGAPGAAADPLLRVVRSDDAPAVCAERAASVEIFLGGARVSVGERVDRATLRDVLEVLGAIERERCR